MSTVYPDYLDREFRAPVATPPPPGEEVAGPAITPLLVEVRHAIRAELALLAQAKLETQTRQQSGLAQGQTDASGNAALQLFQVPGGATGRLVWATLDEAGVTPAAPDTSATLWHAIYAASSAGIFDPTQIIAVGSLLDYRLNAPTRGDALIPDVYSYSDVKAAPTLVGPATFYLVVQAATATRRIACRYTVYIEQPE